ncbi:type II toxin-antitoxin system ParD family antitoxin [Altererythrobacter sp.]|uniref:type II toxin-antitoxin system ParD family antitoxin n=1 Tax=Altererythrobacter sp. TaxID=1872480 RepID=UPI003D095FD2
MGKNTSISLCGYHEAFVRRKVEQGEFGSVGEIIRDALRHYIVEDAKREALDCALKEGLDSGIA